jgi:hypothetical protein
MKLSLATKIHDLYNVRESQDKIKKGHTINILTAIAEARDEKKNAGKSHFFFTTIEFVFLQCSASIAGNRTRVLAFKFQSRSKAYQV